MDLRSRIEASYKRIAKEAHDKGFAIGYEEGYAEGFAIGYAEGFAIGYADSIKDIMDFRFGVMPDKSLSALKEIKDAAVMQSIHNAALSWDRDQVLNLIAQSRPA